MYFIDTYLMVTFLAFLLYDQKSSKVMYVGIFPTKIPTYMTLGATKLLGRHCHHIKNTDHFNFLPYLFQEIWYRSVFYWVLYSIVYWYCSQYTNILFSYFEKDIVQKHLFSTYQVQDQSLIGLFLCVNINITMWFARYCIIYRVVQKKPRNLIPPLSRDLNH